jgi:hypothetical protein
MCDRWSFTLKEQHKLGREGVKNRVLRKISGTKREEVIGG